MNTRTVQRAAARPLGEVFDDPGEFLRVVALPAGVLDELPCTGHYRPTLGCARDGDAAPAAELEEALIAQSAKGTKNRIRVHAELGCQILRRRETLTRLGLAVYDRAADLRSDLLVETGRLLATYLDIDHDAINNSFSLRGAT